MGKLDTMERFGVCLSLLVTDFLPKAMGAGETTEKPTEKIWVDYEDFTEEPFSMEFVVSDPIRVWHIGAIVITAITIIIVILCCIFDCRIPRSKEEIEKNHEKRQIAYKYADQMTKIQIPDMKIVPESTAGSSKDSSKGEKMNERRSRKEGEDRERHGHRKKEHHHRTEEEGEERPRRKKKHRRKSGVVDSATPLAHHPTDMVKPSKKAQLALGVPNEKATARTLSKISSKEGHHRRAKNPKV